MSIFASVLRSGLQSGGALRFVGMFRIAAAVLLPPAMVLALSGPAAAQAAQTQPASVVLHLTMQELGLEPDVPLLPVQFNWDFDRHRWPGWDHRDRPERWDRWNRQPTVLFDNGNIARVYNGAHRPTVFRLDQPATITKIRTYHWNDGWGVWPGSISLRRGNGEVFGPWSAIGELGQGGVFNAYWSVFPNITLQPGFYVIVDSDPSTWAQNRDTGGAGMARIEGRMSRW